MTAVVRVTSREEMYDAGGIAPAPSVESSVDEKSSPELSKLSVAAVSSVPPESSGAGRANVRLRSGVGFRQGILSRVGLRRVVLHRRRTRILAGVGRRRVVRWGRGVPVGSRVRCRRGIGWLNRLGIGQGIGVGRRIRIGSRAGVLLRVRRGIGIRIGRRVRVGARGWLWVGAGCGGRRGWGQGVGEGAGVSRPSGRAAEQSSTIAVRACCGSTARYPPSSGESGLEPHGLRSSIVPSLLTPSTEYM